MTITRETLELAAKAAKAAGLELIGWELGSYLIATNQSPCNARPWSPLTDHGQLLDLAMACKIGIRPSLDCIEYSTWDRRLEVVSVDCQNFPSLAEAVITAAADQQLAKDRQ